MVSHVSSTENYESDDLAVGEGFMEEVVFKIRENWNFSPTQHQPTSWEGRWTGDWIQLPMANDLINHGYVIKPP